MSLLHLLSCLKPTCFFKQTWDSFSSLDHVIMANVFVIQHPLLPGCIRILRIIWNHLNECIHNDSLLIFELYVQYINVFLCYIYVSRSYNYSVIQNTETLTPWVRQATKAQPMCNYCKSITVILAAQSLVNWLLCIWDFSEGTLWDPDVRQLN